MCCPFCFGQGYSACCHIVGCWYRHTPKPERNSAQARLEEQVLRVLDDSFRGRR